MEHGQSRPERPAVLLQARPGQGLEMGRYRQGPSQENPAGYPQHLRNRAPGQ